MKLLQALYRVIEKKPDHEILTVHDEIYCYIDIKKNIDRWKLVLRRSEISPREKIIVYVKKTIDFIGLYFALCDFDCIMIPLDISVNQEIIPQVIYSSKAHAIITSQELDTDKFQTIIPLTMGYTFYRTFYKENDLPDDIMQMLYTSGTTGVSKCVMFSKDNLTNNIIALADALELSEKDIIYTPVSLMLPAALNTVLLPALLSGARIVVSDSAVPGSVLRYMIEQKVTVFFAVPIYYKLMAANGLCTKDNWKNVRLCLTSSAYLSKTDFMEFYNKSNKSLHSIYCSSEAGTIAYNDALDIDSLKKFVGRPLKGCEVALTDVNEEGLGEIIVKGDFISSKYYRNDELNDEVFRDGWVKTGDLGLIHENGYLEIKGRISDSINIAGHLVSPLEIEQIIIKNEAVKDVTAYRYRNRLGNDMLGVKIVAHENKGLSEMDIIKYCERMLPSYKVPKKVLFVKNLDTGRYGKKIRNL